MGTILPRLLLWISFWSQDGTLGFYLRNDWRAIHLLQH